VIHAVSLGVSRLTHSIVNDEKALLQRVQTLLEEEPYISPPSEADIVKDLLRIRDEINHTKDEDRGSLMAQYHQQIYILEQLRAARDKEDVDPDCPYFAHLRLKEKGQERDLCLGKATRIQRGVRIIDWRNAPISKVFYRYQQGEFYEEEFGDRTLSGEVIARRTVTIQRGELRRIDAPEGTFVENESGWEVLEREPPRLAGGAGATLQAHGADHASERRLGTDLQGSRRRQDKRLPDIAGLIDVDQFDLITKPSSGFVVIRGTAGSGKTTIALHRIAYLCYNDPGLNSNRTLFLVFSKALRDYVSHVLPSLGIERVRVQAFPDWLEQQLRAHFPMLPKGRTELTPAAVVRLKLHPALMVALERQVQNVSGPGNAHQAIDDWASILTQKERLASLFREFDPGAFSDRELETVTTWCRERYDELLAWWDDKEENDCQLEHEDAALLLRAWQLRVGPLRFRKKRNLTYRHVALDEVQDFSPLEVRVLLECLDNRQSITLAGDTQQHVMKDAGFTDWSSFFKHLGVPGTSVSTLRVAYRSSREVVSFALKLLGDLREDDSPPITVRSGPPVELFRFTDHGACVAFLADVLKTLLSQEPLASIVLITPSLRVSSVYHQGLQRAEVPALRQVRDMDFSFRPGVELTEITEVKGLEFDYVILVEASAQSYPDTPANRRFLHVGATRAVHQLWLTSVETPSSIIRECLDP
jgi:DNA helicase II / ATP-dependent DNA helicase PcrA